MALKFPAESRSIRRPDEGKTWFDVYRKLEKENKRRLEKFINRTTQKVQAEKESKFDIDYNVVTQWAFFCG